MRGLSTMIAAYPDLATAEKDWTSVESAASSHAIDLRDAALIELGSEGTVEAVERHSHHGRGKGLVAEAVVGLLFPPAIIGAAAVGAGSPDVIARLNRSFDRGDIKDLGEVMDSGEIAMVVLTTADSVEMLHGLLAGATSKIAKASSTAEEIQEALDLALLRLDDAGSVPVLTNTLRGQMVCIDPLVALLSPAEKRVLRQLASHRTLGEIAEHLYVSRSTIKTHVASIYAKLGVSRRSEAVGTLGGGSADTHFALI
jgi:DNA-binding CsgD family transcriptional regulator/uncharacterized membrane protein